MNIRQSLSLYLTDIGRKKRIHQVLPDTHPFNHILFVDDMTLLGQALLRKLNS
jgi:hypothetical protein